VEKGVGNGAVHGGTRSAIEDIGSSGECLGPVTGRHVSVNEEGAADIIQRKENALGLSVLLRSVRTRQSKQNATGGKESCQRAVNKLSTVVSLERLDKGTELGVCIGTKSVMMEATSDLRTKGYVQQK
jgi:hypothetical protein